MTTPYDKKCAILSDLWAKYKEDHEYADFFAFNVVADDVPLDLDKPIASG